MTFIPSDKHKLISRWGLPAFAGLACCMGLLGTQNTLAVWDRMSERQTLARVAEQHDQLEARRSATHQIAEIQQQEAVSEAHQAAQILDYSCGTRLNNFKLNPGRVDGDLIAWGIDPTDPIYNPQPGRWHPLWSEAGQLAGAIRDGSIVTIDSMPGMDAGRICTNGTL